MYNALFHNHAVKKMLAGINERINDKSVSFWLSDDADDLIWDIEKFIADYRESMLS